MESVHGGVLALCPIIAAEKVQRNLQGSNSQHAAQHQELFSLSVVKPKRHSTATAPDHKSGQKVSWSLSMFFLMVAPCIQRGKIHAVMRMLAGQAQTIIRHSTCVGACCVYAHACVVILQTISAPVSNSSARLKQRCWPRMHSGLVLQCVCMAK